MPEIDDTTAVNNSVIERYCEAFRLMRVNNLDDAATKLRELKKYDREYLNAHRYLGIIYMQQGEFTDAINEFVFILNKDQKKFRSLKDRCKDSFDKETDPDGHMAWVHHDLGKAHLELGEYKDAIKYIKESIKIFEAEPKNWFINDLGWAYYKCGRNHEDRGEKDEARKKYKEAIEQYKKAIKLDPKDAHSHFFLGLALIKNGQLSDAEEELNEASDCFKGILRNEKLNPTNKEAWIQVELKLASTKNNLGRIQMEKGSYDDAKDLFLDALKICLNKECQEYIEKLTPWGKRKEQRIIAALHTNMGLLYYKRGSLDEARKEYMEALTMAELPETYNNLAAISNKEGAKENAEFHLNNALRVNPRFKPALTNLEKLTRGTTNWCDWWFEPIQSESSGKFASLKCKYHRKWILGSLLVFTLILLVADMLIASFSGMVTITSFETGPSLRDKMLLASLIFFLLVHPRIEAFALGEVKFNMATEVASSSLRSEGSTSE